MNLGEKVHEEIMRGGNRREEEEEGGTEAEKGVVEFGRQSNHAVKLLRMAIEKDKNDVHSCQGCVRRSHARQTYMSLRGRSVPFTVIIASRAALVPVRPAVCSAMAT